MFTEPFLHPIPSWARRSLNKEERRRAQGDRVLRLGAPMADRPCHDCGGLLAAGGGWIVPLDYPAMDRLIATLDKVSICDPCLLARCGRGTNPPDT
jgi:hypothetical protein